MLRWLASPERVFLAGCRFMALSGGIGFAIYAEWEPVAYVGSICLLVLGIFGEMVLYKDTGGAK